jgi:hypothetical protein
MRGGTAREGTRAGSVATPRERDPGEFRGVWVPGGTGAIEDVFSSVYSGFPRELARLIASNSPSRCRSPARFASISCCKATSGNWA